MKRFIIAGLGALSLAPMALAEDVLPFADLQAVTKLAFDDFGVAQPTHVQHFTGFKTWQSADDARVKIYVNHDGMAMEFNYLCHKHETGLECHRQ